MKSSKRQAVVLIFFKCGKVYRKLTTLTVVSAWLWGLQHTVVHPSRDVSASQTEALPPARPDTRFPALWLCRLQARGSHRRGGPCVLDLWRSAPRPQGGSGGFCVQSSESWFSRWLPVKKRTEAYLPDDKNKSVRPAGWARGGRWVPQWRVRPPACLRGVTRLRSGPEPAPRKQSDPDF